MGNMSNPCINRWGFNTFWYNFWINDWSYSHNLNQDRIFSKLLNLFLFYGINVTYNLFSSYYWYATVNYNLALPTYYRWISRRGEQFGEDISYKLRKEATCVFPMKLWILKYGNWVIFNQYWFYPLQKGQKNTQLNLVKHWDSVNTLPSSGYPIYRKLKTLISTSFLKYALLKSYYSF